MDDENAQQEVVVLGLEYKKNNREERDDEKKLINHLRAQFVATSLAHEVDDARDGQEYQKNGGNNLIVSQKNMIQRGKIELCQPLEMAQRGIEIVLDEEIHRQEPVGSEKAEQRSEKRARTEGLQAHGHQKPEERHEIENFHEEKTGDAEGQKCCEDGHHGQSVLIGVEEKDVENDETQTDDTTANRRKQKRGHEREHEEGARHHTAVDTNERVGVVQLHHQQRGESQNRRLHPHFLSHSTEHQADDDAIDGGQRQSPAALGNLVL